ncbi:8923_t:CDS:2 [Ambispora gerdemannii]|uniref:8923_t:CDS:1 n=1 Tax=Ambispora gerdemannii TaxID=144530 RepID=A0A9N9BZZ9_9GLOM|nr:8923_t:CDS:2 [Ambispora gerdemannii]
MLNYENTITFIFYNTVLGDVARSLVQDVVIGFSGPGYRILEKFGDEFDVELDIPSYTFVLTCPFLLQREAILTKAGLNIASSRNGDFFYSSNEARAS